MSCTKCGAKLEGYSGVCRYCGAFNTVDLHRVNKHTEVQPDEGRQCPCCEIPLTTIDLKIDGKFLVERCDQCLGMFFDPNELQALISKCVSNVFEVDYPHMTKFFEEQRTADIPAVRYISCPICKQHMNRENYGQTSGVIIDKCVQHGVWLDAGELARIKDWVKAGGHLLNDKRDAERQKLEEQRTRKERRHERIYGHDPFPPLGATEVVEQTYKFTSINEDGEEVEEIFEFVTRSYES